MSLKKTAFNKCSETPIIFLRNDLHLNFKNTHETRSHVVLSKYTGIFVVYNLFNFYPKNDLIYLKNNCMLSN